MELNTRSQSITTLIVIQYISDVLKIVLKKFDWATKRPNIVRHFFGNSFVLYSQRCYEAAMKCAIYITLTVCSKQRAVQ